MALKGEAFRSATGCKYLRRTARRKKHCKNVFLSLTVLVLPQQDLQVKLNLPNAVDG